LSFNQEKFHKLKLVSFQVPSLNMRW